MSTSDQVEPQNSTESSSKAAHLKPYHFQPGQSGNPGGRPKKKPITEAYLAALEDPEVCKRIAAAVIAQSLKGNGQILKELTDRVEGKIADAMELSGPDGGPIQTRVLVEFVKPDEPK